MPKEKKKKIIFVKGPLTGRTRNKEIQFADSAIKAGIAVDYSKKAEEEIQKKFVSKNSGDITERENQLLEKEIELEQREKELTEKENKLAKETKELKTKLETK